LDSYAQLYTWSKTQYFMAKAARLNISSVVYPDVSLAIGSISSAPIASSSLQLLSTDALNQDTSTY
jgi:tryptophan synthase alpha subunit